MRRVRTPPSGRSPRQEETRGPRTPQRRSKSSFARGAAGPARHSASRMPGTNGSASDPGNRAGRWRPTPVASPAGLPHTERHARCGRREKAHRHRDSVQPSQPRTARPYGTTSRTPPSPPSAGCTEEKSTPQRPRAAIAPPPSPKASSTTSTNGEAFRATRYPATECSQAKTARRRCGRTMRGTTRSNPSSPSYSRVGELPGPQEERRQPPQR